jgi:LysR family glycine cleavage system transcriptional activator
MDQRYKSLPLNPLRAFAVASRQKTFTAAAQEMGVSQVAVSRQISILEGYLGVQLFERGARSVKLTEAGRAFGQEIAGLFDQIELATRRVLSNERENTINLRVYPTFAHHWLLPRLQQFMGDHRDYRVRLDTAVAPLDFRGTHLDVALQLGHGDWRESRSRKLFDEVVDVVCTPDHLKRHGPIETLADLDGRMLLHSKYRRRGWDLWAKANGAEIDVQGGMEFESSLLTYSACRQGFGLAVGQLDLLAIELTEGDLVRPLGMPVATGSAFYAVWPTTNSVSAKTRHFIDWLLIQAGQEPEFFKKTRAPTQAI